MRPRKPRKYGYQLVKSWHSPYFKAPIRTLMPFEVRRAFARDLERKRASIERLMAVKPVIASIECSDPGCELCAAQREQAKPATLQ